MLRLRYVLVLALLVIAGWGTASSTLEALRPVGSAAPLPRLPTESPTRVRLARHLLFVIVDGLRWDVANDPLTMPMFSVAMRRHTSGEVWASPISMTSSAVLAYGTGQRASLDEVMENLQPPKPRVNSWLQNANAAGLTLMGVGDPIWSQLYGQYLADFHADPVNSAVERDFNAQTFAAARRMQSRSPDFLVVHFVTPDHQGHAYGIRSQQYRSSMRNFDRDLFEWLAPIPPQWTVLVTSDHGAADSGTHGSDTTAQRRSPLFAYGPGIRRGFAAERKLDQVELPGLFAALLGVDNAEQSRGVAPIEWLETSFDQRRQWACTEVERLRRQISSHHGGAALECCTMLDERRDCVREARALATDYDSVSGRNRGIQSRRAWPWVAVVVLAALAIGTLLWGRRALATAVSAGLWLGCSLALTLYVEWLPGALPNVARAVLFAATNGLLLFGAFSAKRLARWFNAHAALALGVFPGWLLVSYSTNTQVEAYCVLVALAALLAATRAHFSPVLEGLAAPTLPWILPEKVIFATSIVALALAGTRTDSVRLPYFVNHPLAEAGLSTVVLLLGLVWSSVVTQAKEPKAGLDTDEQIQVGTDHLQLPQLTAMAIVLLSFALQHLPIHWIGRAGWLITTIGAALCASRRRGDLAFYLGVASYAWVSRNLEWPILVAALTLAELLGRSSARAVMLHGPTSNRVAADNGTATQLVSSARTPAWYAVHVAFLISLCFLLYIGLQGGLQLQNLDLTAGSFGSAAIPVWLTSALVVYKFIIAEALLLVVFLRKFDARLRERLLIALGAAFLLRGVALLLMLFVCGNSYWTAFRVMADLPFAWLSVIVIVLALGAQTVSLHCTVRHVFERRPAPDNGFCRSRQRATSEF